MDYQILINFDTTWLSNNYQSYQSIKRLLLHYLGKSEQAKYCISTQCSTI